ncbi:MAG: CBS domain-containing protein [Bryobacteraceae bacterium]|nr:CBS domain-containing protein [Bryobacteraceae bacterium]
MTANPITVPPEATVEETARLFLRHRIGCVPVVGAEGGVIGLVTERDLFLRERRVPFSTVVAHSLMGAWVDPEHLEECYGRLRGIRVSEIMRRDFVTISPETPMYEAALLMVRFETNHLPVVEGGRLVGILARHDLLRALARPCEPWDAASPGRAGEDTPPSPS